MEHHEHVNGVADRGAPPERKTISVEEAGRLLGISRGHAYQAAKRGELPTIKIGRCILVPRVALERMLESAALSK